MISKEVECPECGAYNMGFITNHTCEKCGASLYPEEASEAQCEYGINSTED
jgi:hypothetical protein